MHDLRLEQLAKNIIHHSLKLQRGERLLIECGIAAEPLLLLLMREAAAVGATPYYELTSNRLEREFLLLIDSEGIKTRSDWEVARMRKMDAYIRIGADDNPFELKDVPTEKTDMAMKYLFDPVHRNIRLKIKWTVLRYPTPSAAQHAGTSRESFEDFYFSACCLDYKRLGEAMIPLREIMENGDRVRITGTGTDISFSINSIPTIICAGEKNIPDGEIFTAPVKDSVEGRITYNVPSLFRGFTFEEITFTFKKGKIIEAASNDTERINKLLDIDEGARFIGEFSLGTNPFITHPMKNTLFDEKIAGSFHLTPGNAYDEADNGNRSSLHWDLVMVQTPEYGGGEIWIDGQLIRKDGDFVPESLHPLNRSFWINNPATGSGR